MTVADLRIGSHIGLSDFFGKRTIGIVERIEDRPGDFRTLTVRCEAQSPFAPSQTFVLHRSAAIASPVRK